MMKQMGIKTTEVDAAKVIIEKKDGTRLVVNEPSVSIIEMQGQKTLQVSGKFSEEAGQSGGESAEGKGSDAESDVQLIVAQTGASEEAARKALEESGGDIATAILNLEKG